VLQKSRAGWPAGTRCPFGLRGEVLRDRELIRTLSTHPDGSPDLEEIIGPLVFRLTNTETGRSVVRNLSGTGLLDHGTDGSFVLYLVGGHFGAGLAPGDPGGPAWLYFTGTGHALAQAADGSRTPSSATARSRTCAKPSRADATRSPAGRDGPAPDHGAGGPAPRGGETRLARRQGRHLLQASMPVREAAYEVGAPDGVRSTVRTALHAAEWHTPTWPAFSPLSVGARLVDA
jgi:hypothetical protein